MMRDERPFFDLVPTRDGGCTLPLRKWRELLFIGAMRADGDGLFRRDPSRPLPPMARPDFFAPDRRYRAERVERPRKRPPDPKNPPQRDRSRIRLVPDEG